MASWTMDHGGGRGGGGGPAERLTIYAPPPPPRFYVCRFTDSGSPDFRLSVGHPDSRFPDSHALSF